MIELHILLHIADVTHKYNYPIKNKHGTKRSNLSSRFWFCKISINSLCNIGEEDRSK